MSYRGRKRRLVHFKKNAREFMQSVYKSGGLSQSQKLKLDTQSNRLFLRAAGKETTGTRQRLAVKKEEDLISTKLWQHQITKAIKNGSFKPKHFTYVPFKSVILKNASEGVQEYFHKPNAQQLLNYIKATKEKRPDEFMTKDEYELCKKFMKNKVNKGVTKSKILNSTQELLNFIAGPGNWQEMHYHNILIQGVNRNGTLRITLIDV
jgi:hypothetical protein